MTQASERQLLAALHHCHLELGERAAATLGSGEPTAESADRMSTALIALGWAWHELGNVEEHSHESAPGYIDDMVDALFEASARLRVLPSPRDE